MNKRLTDISSELAEFKGQIVDILEDALADKDAMIPNRDREEAIEDGEDEEDLAIIYGDDYDIIADTVQDIVLSKNLEEHPISTESGRETFLVPIMEAYQELIDKAVFPDGGFTDAEMTQLKTNVTNTFVNWKLFV